MLHTVANTLKANNVTSLPVRAEAVMAENKAMSQGAGRDQGKGRCLQGDQPV